MTGFSINMKGRVDNYNLPDSKPLMPLFEVVVNSLLAIEELVEKGYKTSEPYINIEVIREPQIIMEEVPETLSPICSFIIRDNGIGFDENNFDSFTTSDSSYRATKGGKGVGRFSWLKAFDNVHIDSVFRDPDNVLCRRSFDFIYGEEEVNDDVEKYDESTFETIVSLNEYKEKYKEKCPKHLDIIALKIIQHCVVYFISDNCPRITINDSNDTIDLNKLFKEKIDLDENKDKFTIEGYEFNLLHLKNYDLSNGSHSLHLCANSREVDTRDLSKTIINLRKRIGEEGNEYYYSGILTSFYFDQNVDMNRLSFSEIPKTRSLLHEPSMEAIEEKAKEKIIAYLQEPLDKIQEEKIKGIEKYIREDAPRYRHLLKYKRERIDEIKPGLRNEDLDDALNMIKREMDKELEHENNELITKMDSEIYDMDAYKQEFSLHMDKVTEASKDILVEYTVRRKAIITLLERGICRKEDGKFNKEEFVHKIIFPLKKTSDEVIEDSHNLWLIDERLSYHYYLASDIPFNNSRDEKRADILICDTPIAVVDDDGPVYQSIVIFELKKPMREKYEAKDNPITQVYGYIKEIKTGKKDKYGRQIRVSENTQYYTYIICDITADIKEFADDSGLTETPDKLGYYGFNQNHDAYIEIISYEKLLDNAKKRNRVLFNKAGI